MKKKKLLTLLLEGDGKMMKKMLVLMLVLGMASLANAAVVLDWGGDEGIEEITVPVCTTVTISVNSDTVESWAGYLEIDYPEMDKGHLYDGVMYPIAGEMGCMDEEYEEDVYQGFFLTAAEGPEPAVPMEAGTWFEAEFHCDAVGDVTIWLYDGELEVLDSIVVHIPEPATIALLGLGSLFLMRRRRK